MRAKNDNWGGARQGSGRAVRNIHLDTETARTLRLLKLQSPGSADEHQIVANLIKQAWSEIDTTHHEAGHDTP